MLRKLTSQKVSTILLSGFLLVNIFAIFTTSFFLHDSKKQYKLQAYSTTKNFSEILSNNIAKTFEKAEIIINSTDNQIQNFGLTVSTENFILEESHYLADLHNIIFINNSGKIIYDVSKSSISDFSKEKFFKETLENNGKQMFIHHGEINHENYIVFSKKIVNLKTNKSMGVLALMLPISSLLQNFNTLDVGPHGLLALRDNNYNFVARFPPVPEGQQSSLPSKKFLELSARLNAASYETITPLDQMVRIFSYKKINRFNYYVIVGLSEKDFLAPWNKEFIQFTLIYFFFAIMFAFFSYAIYFLWKKESQKENKLSSILRSSSEGMYGVDDRGMCTFCNSQALLLLGYNEEIDLIGKPINKIIFSPEFHDHKLIDNSNLEIILRKRNGTNFYAEIWQHPQLYDNEISSSIITFVDISEKKDINKLVWKQANYDSLTGIPNRSFFETKLQETINQSQFDDSNFAVLFIDLDHFKDINDNLGHHSGDLLLIQVAERLQSCVRDRDIVARLGGDEFTIILTKIKDKSHIEKVCVKIIEEIQKPFIIHNQPCNIGSSIGITYFPEDTTLLEQLLQNADKAMYVAKERGRNCYNFFSKDLDLIIKQRTELSQDLKKAIDNNELELFAQPIVNSQTGKMVKAEVLLRWKHSTKGYVSPNDFIKVDRSFISDLKQEKNKKITRSLISMARNLGIQVIAEGVETEEQSQFLKDIKCDYSQGFLFSKPIAIQTLKFDI